MYIDIPKEKMVELFGDPDQCSVASDLGLHCLPVTRLWVSSLQWVNVFKICWMNGKQCRLQHLIWMYTVSS